MAKILQIYLIKELFRTFLPALLCFELLVLLGFSVQLIHKGLDVPNLAYIVPYLALYALPHALPSSLLAATVMTYGRLSADNEIAAVKTAGLHLHNIISPIVIIGIFFSILSLYLYAELLPMSYFKVRSLQEKAVKQVLAKHFIAAKRKINFHPYQIYVSNVEGGIYKDIAVFEYAEDYIVSVLLSEEGEIEINEAGDLASLTLRRGEFIRPNIKNNTDVPKMGSFEEATFVIPIRQKVHNTALKYASLTNLLTQKKTVDMELVNSKEKFEDPRKTLKAAIKNISKTDNKLDMIKRRLEKELSEIKDSETNILRQAGVIKRADQDIDIFENYIRVANNNIEKLMRSERSAENNNNQEFVESSVDTQDSEDEYSKKILLIKEIIEREKRRVQDAREKILIAEKTRSDESRNIAKAKSNIEEVGLVKAQLEKEHSTLSERIESSKRQKLKRALTMNIHKRLSLSFSCLTFILIGIPLGIMTRSSSMLISLGISFVVVLFFYYPLVATGLILADSYMFPIIPSLWGANGFTAVLGLVLFWRVLKR